MMDPTVARELRKSRARNQVKTTPAATANTSQNVSCWRGYRCSVAQLTMPRSLGWYSK